MTIRPKLGVALILKFTIKSYPIHRIAALIFRTLYPWLYEVLALRRAIKSPPKGKAAWAVIARAKFQIAHLELILIDLT